MPILLNQRSDPIDFFLLVAETSFETDWIKPEFCFAVIALNVNVGRFGTIASVKEEPIRPEAKYGRHARHIIAGVVGQQYGPRRITTASE